MAMAIDEKPAPQLPMTKEEEALVDSVIDDINRVSKRLNIDTHTVRKLSAFSDDELTRIDKLIADSVDKLRPVLKIDFVEKLHDRLHWKIWQPDSDYSEVVSYIALRMSNTMSYIIAITKKYRGIARPAGVTEPEARAELKHRGLWKK